MPNLLPIEADLVLPYGIMAIHRIKFPEGFDVVVDTIDIAKRQQSGEPGMDILKKFDTMMGRRGYETAIQIEVPGRTLDPRQFPPVIVARYPSEQAAWAGHETFVDEVRRGRVSWQDMDTDKPIVKNAEFSRLLKKRDSILRGERVREYKRRR